MSERDDDYAAITDERAAIVAQYWLDCYRQALAECERAWNCVATLESEAAAHARDQYWLAQLRGDPCLANELRDLRAHAQALLNDAPRTEDEEHQANFYFTLAALLEGREPPPKRTFGARLSEEE